MMDRELIERKLLQISRHLADLKEVAKRPREEFLTTPLHYEAERLIELLVGNALDVNFHIIKEQGLPAPTKYKDSFLELGRAGILPSELATRIADSAGLRNLLVHHYDDVDLGQLYDGLAGGLKDYDQYRKAIYHFLKRTENSN